MNPVFCAIDTPDLAAAEKLVDSLRGNVGGIKLGLEFFMAHGAAGYSAIAIKACRFSSMSNCTISPTRSRAR